MALNIGQLFLRDVDLFGMASQCKVGVALKECVSFICKYIEVEPPGESFFVRFDLSYWVIVISPFSGFNVSLFILFSCFVDERGEFFLASGDTELARARQQRKFVGLARMSKVY